MVNKERERRPDLGPPGRRVLGGDRKLQTGILLGKPLRLTARHTMEKPF